MVLSHGCSREFVDGFVSANKRIYMIDETFLRWRKLRTEYNLSTDDMLAHCLLLTKRFSRGQQQRNPSFSQAQSFSNGSPSSIVRAESSPILLHRSCRFMKAVIVNTGSRHFYHI